MNKCGQPYYTYLIGWRKLDRWYYGFRGRNSKSPAQDLWTRYKTSSKHVKDFVVVNGPPDVIRVHKIFEHMHDAINQEQRFLHRVRAVKSDRWINRYNFPDGFKQLEFQTEETKRKIGEKSALYTHDKETRARMSASRKAFLATPEGQVVQDSLKRAVVESNRRRKGSTLSEQGKANIATAAKASYANGRVPTNLGKHFSDETRARLSAAAKKRSPWTQERKDKHAAARRGKKRPGHSEKMKTVWASKRGGLTLSTTAALELDTTPTIAADGWNLTGDSHVNDA